MSSFQLPRIAKPSGTRLIGGTHQVAGVEVSTSPDSKAIRNGSQLAITGSFKLVSTSPDSKAIRNPSNQATGHSRIPTEVSTSPDSKAIRNRKFFRLAGNRF